jgi:hypothetical protein
MKDLIWLLETVDTGIDIASFPRILYRGSLEPRRHSPEHEQPNVGGRAHEGDEDGGGDRACDITHATEHERHEERTRNEQDPWGVDNQRRRQFPEAPRTRRPSPDDEAYGGWDVIDHPADDQCANRPPSVYTVEIIPNSLQTEWTEAWNAVHRLRQAAMGMRGP